MLKILVILTGGTIGSELNGEYIATASGDNKYQIIELYKESNPDISRETVFDTANPYTILSENLSGCHINKLLDSIKQASRKKDEIYDGIIVTHGTDTLQYSASAAALAFNDTAIPIIFVSSNYILTDKKANGLNNFSLAVNYIREKKTPGVYTAYDSEIKDCLCLLPHMSYSDKLYDIELSSDTLKAVFDDFTDKSSIKDIKLSDNAPILYLKAVPGQVYPDIDKSKIKAILLETYHSGTLGTDNAAFSEFCETAYKFNVPVYVVGVDERDQYESTRLYKNLHLNVLIRISPVIAYMKLWFLFSI